MSPRMLLIRFLTPWLLVVGFHCFVSASRHKTHHHHVSCPDRSALRVAFVTAMIDDYEKTCKRPAPQTFPADFLAYTDNYFHTEVATDKKLAYNSWTRLDAEPYRYGMLARDRHPGYVNSFVNNNNSFNRAKFFKQNLHRLPELAGYHIIVWLDATVQITNPDTAKYLVDYFCERNVSILTIRHDRANLLDEVNGSMRGGKYMSNTFYYQYQPIQDVQKQYEQYVGEGYKDEFFGSPSNAVPVTCFVAFNMIHEISHLFLEHWWMQNLQYSTQDQVSFPYVAWSLGVRPYLIPDDRIHGNDDKNTFYVRTRHSVRRLLQGDKEHKCILNKSKTVK